MIPFLMLFYRQTSSIRPTLVGNTSTDHSVEPAASPVGAAQNYIYILDLIPGYNGLGKDNVKTEWEISNFCNFVRLVLEVWW